MRAYALFVPVVFFCCAGAAKAQPLKASEVFKIHRESPEALTDRYRALINETYVQLKEKAKNEKQMIEGLKDHGEVFDRLISLAVANPNLAKVSAEWVLNGKAIAPQVIAEQLQGIPKKEHYVELREVCERLPADSMLVEIVQYNRYTLKEDPNSKISGQYYAAWLIPPGPSNEITIVDLGEKGAIKDLIDVFNGNLKAAENTASSEGGLERLLKLKEGNLGREVNSWNKSLAAIREKTLDKIDEAAKGRLYQAKHWVLGPAADLWLVPFAALPLKNVEKNEDANKTKYAIEDHKITYVVTGRDIVVYGKPGPADRSDALILARPDFGPRRSGGTTGLLSAVGGDSVAFQLEATSAAPPKSPRGLASPAEFFPPSNARYARATLIVDCPAESKVQLNGVPFFSTGPVRKYFFSPLPTQADRIFEVKVEVERNGKRLAAVKKVSIRGGQVVRVTLDPSGTPGPGGPRGFLLSTLNGEFEDVEKLQPLANKLKEKLKTNERSPNLLVLKEASEPAFYENISKRGTLIFCTHGFFQEAVNVNPLTMGGLALADANKMYKKDIPQQKSIDGLLTGLEISQEKLQDVDLVVMIACQTSQGKVLRAGLDEVDGGSIASLRHAFRLAGARTVVATLWKIPPEAGDMTIVGEGETKPKSFFDNLITGKMLDKGQALHDAQVNTIMYLRSTNNGLAHPFFWASFALTGDWGVVGAK